MPVDSYGIFRSEISQRLSRVTAGKSNSLMRNKIGRESEFMDLSVYCPSSNSNQDFGLTGGGTMTLYILYVCDMLFKNQVTYDIIMVHFYYRRKYKLCSESVCQSHHIKILHVHITVNMIQKYNLLTRNNLIQYNCIQNRNRKRKHFKEDLRRWKTSHPD